MASNNFINWVLAIVVLLLFFGIIANSNDEITGKAIEKGDDCTSNDDCKYCVEFCNEDNECQDKDPEMQVCDIDNSCREAGSCPDCLSDSDCLTCTETCDQGSCLPSGKEICPSDSPDAGECKETCALPCNCPIDDPNDMCGIAVREGIQCGNAKCVVDNVPYDCGGIAV